MRNSIKRSTEFLSVLKLLNFNELVNISLMKSSHERLLVTASRVNAEGISGVAADGAHQARAPSIVYHPQMRLVMRSVATVCVFVCAVSGSNF